MKKVFLFFVIFILTFTLFSSCKKEEVIIPEEKPIISQEVKNFIKNPLTGLPTTLETSANLRPVAIMVNNIGAALPHRGLSKADIVYEVVVEGGITRLLALFSDTENLPYVGPVRSTRHYYIDFALPYNAIFLHFGGSPAGYERINSTNIDNIDGMTYTNFFYQDKQRASSKGKEHSFFISNKELKTLENKLNLSLEGNTEAPFLFYENEYFPKNNDAENVFASFSKDYNSEFSYNLSTGLYSKKRNGQNHIDADTKNILQYKNILILYTSIGSYNGEALRREVSLSSGKGYYITNGGKEEITWKKGKSANQFTFTDSNNEPLKVNKGKTYICILGNERETHSTIK